MRATGQVLARLTKPSSSHGHRPRAVLWILILVALGLRLVRLTSQPLWWDEGWSLYFATADIGTMLQLTAVDIHPPFYYLLLHVWIGLFGSSVFSVRLLSVLIGTAALPVLYVTGRRLLGERGALWAALLLAFSPFHVYYSQEVRMYGLVTLLGLVTVIFALLWESDTRDRRYTIWVGYVLAATAAMYTQYYAAFLLLALNLVVLVGWLQSRPPVRRIIFWLGAQLAVVALFLPWLWYAGGRLLTYIRFKVSVEKDPALDLLTYVGRHLAAFNWGHAEGLLADWRWLGLLPLVVLAVLFPFALWRRARQDEIGERGLGIGHWSVAILLVALLCGFIVNVVFPFNPPRSERLLLWALPAYLLLFAAALLILWRRRPLLAILPAALLLALGALSLGFFYTTPRYPDDDYRPVAARIRALALPTDAIISVHPWQVGYFQAYIPDDDARPKLELTPREVLPREQQLWDQDPLRMATDLEVLLAEHGRLWVPAHQAMGRVLERRVEAYLTEHAYPALREWYGENTVLSLFASGDPVAQPVAAQFGASLALERAALSPGPLEAGWGIVATDLVWRLSEGLSEPYHLGLRLADGTGRIWAQRDSAPGGGLEEFTEWPVGESHPDRQGLLVPAGTPPGDYLVMLQVYRSEDVAVLPVTFEGGSGGEVALGTVRVARPAKPPPIEALEIEQPLQADFGPWLRLLGTNRVSGSVLRPGEAVEVDLFWQALVDPGGDLLPRLQLLGPDGQMVAERTEKPVAGTYPTAWWKAGELVRDPHALPIPATVTPGRYRLALGLVRAADGTPVETRRGQTAVELAEIEVQGRDHRYEPTEPEHVQRALFGPSVELVGYDLREVVRVPGSPLEVTLHWRALETPDKNYHSFVHLLDPEGNILAQHDGTPGSEGDEMPTLGWLPGETLTDTHQLPLPFDLPDGDYHLGIGLYDPATSQRLGDRVLLDTPVPVSASQGCVCP